MEDSSIIELYNRRSEHAISETAAKYGAYCYRIAYNILCSPEDSEESVNDTYLRAWNSIPPHCPRTLATFLGKICRNLSLDRYRSRSREKRGGGQAELAIEELEQCIGSDGGPEQEAELHELTVAITRFLGELPASERELFVGRYWFMASVKELGRSFGFSESKVKTMLSRCRRRLKVYLESEGLI